MYKKLIVGLIVTMSPFTSGMMSLNKDIARNQIQPWLAFQEISRLKQLSKYCNELYDIESNCPYVHGNVCSTYACNRCAKSYYYCTKMLVYCALKNNEQMFKHLWGHHRNIRKNDVAHFMKKSKKKLESKIKGEKCYYSKPEVTIKGAMDCYRSRYGVLKNIYRHIFDSVMDAIKSQNVVLANTVLSGSGLSIFDLIQKTVEDFDDLDSIFYNACSLQSTDLLKNICGGFVDENSFVYIIYYADQQLLFSLIDKDILPVESATKDGKKSVLHYAAQCGFGDVVRIALEKGAYVNCRDFKDKTPLHYAAKRGYLGVVTELLKSPDADVRLKDKKKKTAIDYNVPQIKHFLCSPKMSDARKEIARLLKDHRDQHQASGYSYSKVHANGYQIMHI